MGTRGTFGTPKKRAAFISALEAGRTVEEAATLIGAGRRTVYHWKRNLSDFRQAWETAVDIDSDDLEAKLTEVAMGGDVQALLGMLRARKPERYNPTLLIRKAMLQLALEKARAESGLTIEGRSEARAWIYPAAARLQIEAEPEELEPGPAPVSKEAA